MGKKLNKLVARIEALEKKLMGKPQKAKTKTRPKAKAKTKPGPKRKLKAKAAKPVLPPLGAA